MKNFPRSVCLFLAAIIVVLSSNCWSISVALAAELKLRIGLIRTDSALPYFVMREQGFDKRNGLLFEAMGDKSGAQILTDLAAGTLDVSVTAGSIPVFFAAQKGLIPSKVVLVGASSIADPDHPSAAVLASPAIKTWTDLKGRHIAITDKRSINTIALTMRLKQEGVRDYRLLEMAYPNIGLAVAGGNAAAASLSEPYLTQSILRGDGKLLGWVIGGAPFERFQLGMIAVNADLYRNNPQAVKAYLRGHLQSLKWISQNPDGARSILSKWMQLTPEVTKKIKLKKWPLDARNDPDLLDTMQRRLLEAGVLHSQIPARQLYDERLLDEVLKERR
ncbi:MAG: hypothetical protein A3G40_05585 [Deltaproteobacteria bacterium RIFCSPLOWO2_12_FULL_57_22]|nr:MAG: hypothetical protein A3G40_05585 [Deltaproteobacteria bacterium RIFCSPLOWO2_12_FULL_57_22]